MTGQASAPDFPSRELVAEAIRIYLRWRDDSRDGQHVDAPAPVGPSRDQFENEEGLTHVHA